MFHQGQLEQLARVVGVSTGIPRRTPIHDRRTYGLFRDRELVAVFVAGLHDDCVGWERYYGKGFTVFMLMEWDVTVMPDCGRVVERLKSRYTFEVEER
jgi:hypothetical protein